MAYGDFKDLTRRTASDCIFWLHTASEQILHNKASNIAVKSSTYIDFNKENNKEGP